MTDAGGRLIKETTYDSFGVPYHDTLPDLFMPIGFAGGLADPDTGLVRFGWRDYDPTVGRFTAPDPLGDTGGDHDLYDYCVDDPVGFIDRAGLEEEKVWDEPNLLQRMLPFFLLPSRHPYREQVREALIRDVGKKAAGFGTGILDLHIKTPSPFPAPDPEQWEKRKEEIRKKYK